MDTTVAKPSTDNKTWSGGNRPLNASYGKMMMWFFIVSDALTFSGFLAAYGFSRFKFIDVLFVCYSLWVICCKSSLTPGS